MLCAETYQSSCPDVVIALTATKVLVLVVAVRAIARNLFLKSGVKVLGEVKKTLTVIVD